MAVVLTFLLLILASAECREMCYNCQYTITSTKQGIECSDHFNETSKMYRCQFSCLIRTLRNTVTKTITSTFRGCAEHGKSGCDDINGVTQCSYSCDKDLCNAMSIDELEEKYDYSRSRLVSDEEEKTSSNEECIYWETEEKKETETDRQSDYLLCKWERKTPTPPHLSQTPKSLKDGKASETSRQLRNV
ncbi:Hypothetical predicted protein [Octopus vulgaris]|uniref:Uncharacterized protein n=1 Tax=Octopus vulgaris TaxID=6645 RepID=A0AA36BJD9_OCTVU|nr:Hypothetical predicted protein [Octopus vulgaris]